VTKENPLMAALSDLDATIERAKIAVDKLAARTAWISTPAATSPEKEPPKPPHGSSEVVTYVERLTTGMEELEGEILRMLGRIEV
jgi:hypothetical protein